MIAQEAGRAEAKSNVVPNLDLGYSGTPLAAKLGLKDGQAVVFVALPEPFGHLAEAKSFASVLLAASATDLRLPRRSVDLIHGFFMHEAAMRLVLPLFRDAIRDVGSIWVSWPKKASRLVTDLSDEVVRRAALAIGLVDIKVCAIDATWSGLKLVVPRAARTHHP
jgi:hypothetical protein